MVTMDTMCPLDVHCVHCAHWTSIGRPLCPLWPLCTLCPMDDSTTMDIFHNLMSCECVHCVHWDGHNGRPLCPLDMSIVSIEWTPCGHCVHLPKWTQPTNTENSEWTQWTSIVSIGHVHCVHPHVHWTCPMDTLCPLCPLCPMDTIHKPTCTFTQYYIMCIFTILHIIIIKV